MSWTLLALYSIVKYMKTFLHLTYARNGYCIMKKNLRSIIALLLIIFNISIIFDNSFINNFNNGNVSVYSDEDNNTYDKNK